VRLVTLCNHVLQVLVLRFYYLIGFCAVKRFITWGPPICLHVIVFIVFFASLLQFTDRSDGAAAAGSASADHARFAGRESRSVMSLFLW
jgi:hypothetical protein